jgi:hypothetical protein
LAKLFAGYAWQIYVSYLKKKLTFIIEQSEEEVTSVKLQKFEENFFFVLHFYTFLNGTSFYATELLTHSSKSQTLQYF